MLRSARRAFPVLAAVVAAVAAGPLPAEGGEAVEDSLLSFVLGDYVIVGREPNGGGAYSGSARIEGTESGLVLKRRRGEREVTATGRWEVPSPPGEGRVLRFRWQDPDPTIMTCLVGSDLDNYARLTCIWLREGSQPAEPGLEAMFPTAAWESFKPN
jgi:hypothetical protein